MIRSLIICLLLVALFACCVGEPPEPPEIVPFYVNNSGVAVNLILVMETKQSEYTEEDTTYYKITHTTHKQEIKNNDTLCNYYLGRSCSRNRFPWEIHGGEHENSAYFKIEFLSEPKTCLVFDGDKIDNDIRYWENYILTEETPLLHVYYYYITPQHKAMAKEEDCQGSISE